MELAVPTHQFADGRSTCQVCTPVAPVHRARSCVKSTNEIHRCRSFRKSGSRLHPSSRGDEAGTETRRFLLGSSPGPAFPFLVPVQKEHRLFGVFSVNSLNP